MPVEIKKLIIKAVVDAPDTDATPGSGTSTDYTAAEGQEALIQACVKQVLQILKQTKQR